MLTQNHKYQWNVNIIHIKPLNTFSVYSDYNYYEYNSKYYNIIYPIVSRAWAVGSLTLLFLQSVTWSSGLMFLSAPSLLLAYLFSSLNTAQALLITILHCTLARKVCHVVSERTTRFHVMSCEGVHLFHT